MTGIGFDDDPLAALDDRLEAVRDELDHGDREDARRELRQARQLVDAIEERST